LPRADALFRGTPTEVSHRRQLLGSRSATVYRRVGQHCQVLAQQLGRCMTIPSSSLSDGSKPGIVRI
jgi:hypothetical protein